MTKVPLTDQGAVRLRDELKQLKSVDRPQVIDAIARAREHGDLKENAEYHAAREQQGFIEARIKEIEGSLSNAQIIDVSKVNAQGKVVFGATIELIDVENEAAKRYQIVGELEADIKQGRISVASPLARAVIGKQEGDVVEVDTPRGRREFEIAGVEYA